MTKQEMITKYIESVKKVNCGVSKIYGVPQGIGYDLIIKVTFKNGDESFLDAHANATSWAISGLLRPYQVERINYKGKNPPERYIKAVTEYWEDNFKSALREYFTRFKKRDLEKGFVE